MEHWERGVLYCCSTGSERRAKSGTAFKRTFRAELFEKLFSLGPGFIDRKRSGELINTLWEKVERVSHYLFLLCAHITDDPGVQCGLRSRAVCAAVWFTVQPVVGVVILLGGLLVTAAPPLFHKLLKTGSEKEWNDNDAGEPAKHHVKPDLHHIVHAGVDRRRVSRAGRERGI